MTLNEKKFFEERAELDADKEEEKQIEDQVTGDRPVFSPNFYNNEILAIALDYLNLGSNNRVAGHLQKASAVGSTP